MATNIENLINSIFTHIEELDYIKDNNISVATLIKTPAVDTTGGDVTITAKIIDKKSMYGSTSITFTTEVKDVQKPMHTTIYLSEKKFGDIIIFVNDVSHDLITAGSGKTAIEKILPHINRYFENSIRLMLGIKSPENEGTK